MCVNSIGIQKLNTTAYHPQCDGLVERYNRTLKTALRKHAARFGTQWDKLLPGVLWAYRNTPHEATHEKPSYLLFGMDLRSPTEAALLSPTEIEPRDVRTCREELTISLSSARELAAQSIRQAQQKYKASYDQGATATDYRVGDWILIKFPSEESGKGRKLSRPWHGPFRIVSVQQPDVTAVKVYRPQDPTLKVHQTRIAPCPEQFPAGYFWYGGKRAGPGRPPKWVKKLLSADRIRKSKVKTATGHEPPGEAPVEDCTGAMDNNLEDGELHKSPTLNDEVPSQPEESTSVPQRNTGRYELRRRVIPPS